MSEKDSPVRDAFSTSLGGMSVLSGFVVIPVVADDRIRKRIHEPRRESPEGAANDAPHGLDGSDGRCAA